MSLKVAVQAAKRVAESFGASTFLEPSDRDKLAEALKNVSAALVDAAVDLCGAPMDSCVAMCEHLKELLRVLNAAESASAVGQVAALVLRGPFAQHLRTSLATTADLMDALQSLASGETNGDAGAQIVDGTPPGVLQQAGRQIRTLPLEGLERGAAWYEMLRAELLPADEAERPQEEAAEALVRQALMDAGVPASDFEGGQAREELVEQLLDLTGAISSSPRQAAGSSLLTAQDRDLFNAVAAALLCYTPPTQPKPASEPDAGAAGDGEEQGSATAAEPSTSAAAAPAIHAQLTRLRLPRSLMCPITQMLMRDPVTTATGHTYEREAIESWLQYNNTDPMTKAVLHNKDLVPAWAVKGAIEEWLREAGLTHDQYEEAQEEEPLAGLLAVLRRPNPSSSVVNPSSMDARRPSPSMSGSSSSTVSESVGIISALEEYESHDDNTVVGPLSTSVSGNSINTAEESRPFDQGDEGTGPGGDAYSHSTSYYDSDSGASDDPEIDGYDRPARLFDYVTVSNGAGPSHGIPLQRGEMALVVMDDRSETKPLRVLSLQYPRQLVWCERAAVRPITCVTNMCRSDRPGVPVTPFTSEPGMLVRRGFDWKPPAGVTSAYGDTPSGSEVGVLVACSRGGLSWMVHWQYGSENIMRTGEDNKFELLHLQVRNSISGAPVADEAGLVPGCAVVRGLHWTWDDEQSGGPDSIGSLERASKEGWVASRWPNKCLARYRARGTPQLGFDLNYVDRPGEPVTVYNAWPGMWVVRGVDWKWGAQDSDGGIGRLVQPTGWANGKGVWWKVEWADGTSNGYRVGKPGSGWCDLQVPTFHFPFDAGDIEPGTPVVLAGDYESCGNAKDGPLTRNDLGVVVACLERVGRRRFGPPALLLVHHIRSATSWRYARAALRPLPGKLAAERFPNLVRLNRDGRAAFRGGSIGGPGGDTGRSPSQIFYCGAKLHQCRCGGCDGQCGPSNGCPCHACLELIGLRVATVPDNEGANHNANMSADAKVDADNNASANVADNGGAD